MPSSPRTHPQPSELAVQKWLKSLAVIQDVDVAAGWDALGSWDGQHTLVTVDDVFSNLSGPSGVQNCVQIDVWSPDRAEEISQAIWRAAKTADITPLSKPQFIPGEGGRCTLSIEFHMPTETDGLPSSDG